MKITVQHKAGELSFDCDNREPILYAGLRQGINLPFECATGTCGTCRARVMAGEVEVRWKEAPGGARLKPDKGDILMCQTWPLSDCTLRVPAELKSADDIPPMPRRGVIRDIRRLTRDVAQFDLQLSEPMAFHAGQFVVIEAPNVSGGRAYSMVNFATGLDRLSLLLKRKPGGGFSDWFFDQIVGEPEVQVFGPLGRATFRPEERRNIVCIAGGSGIAGMMAILECAVRAEHFRAHVGTVFFGVRTLADTFYLEQLSRFAAASQGNLEVTVALSEEAPALPLHADFPILKLAHGMVHDVAAKSMAERNRDALIYVAGPPIMVDSSIRALITGGVAVRDIRYDKFA
ncbi:MAG TPA: 2Fe-2S iron-sulfur cluster binding domain-containing protein [Xanthobacteraceae bacterium]|nr:2Fe-2S iron-sulfur cluster binding domain-containing protein [Xanthobacteraceae bacterium]